MSLYERIWKDAKNRTVLISSIILLTTLILAVLFASWGYNNVPEGLKGLYLDDISQYNVGLTILTGFLVSIFYFFLLITLATISEIRANLPSWRTFATSSVISILVTSIVLYLIRFNAASESNFNTGMQWTVYGFLIVTIFLSIVYIFFTEPSEDDEKDKAKTKEKSKKKK